MENYSKELIEQEGRREYMTEFLNTFEQRAPREMVQVEALSHPPISRPMNWYLTHTQKRNHFGQVVPIEDVEQIFKLAEGLSGCHVSAAR